MVCSLRWQRRILGNGNIRLPIFYTGGIDCLGPRPTMQNTGVIITKCTREQPLLTPARLSTIPLLLPEQKSHKRLQNTRYSSVLLAFHPCLLLPLFLLWLERMFLFRFLNSIDCLLVMALLLYLQLSETGRNTAACPTQFMNKRR